MAKRSKKSADWVEIEFQYRANVMTVAEIARKYGVLDTTIRQRARRNGWEQVPKADRAQKVKKLTARKADQVSEAVSIGRASEGVTVESLVDQAIDQDVQDMNLGLANARKALIKAGKLMEDVTVDVLLESGEAQTDVISAGSRELKMLTEVTKTSIEIIRKIRGLDELEDPSNDLSNWTEDQLKNELERLS